jgi:hypothetical protein
MHILYMSSQVLALQDMKRTSLSNEELLSSQGQVRYILMYMYILTRS